MSLQTQEPVIQETEEQSADKMPPLTSLFDFHYLRPMTPLQWAVLILYAPFGTVIAILRIVLTVILCSFAILSKKFLPWTISDRVYVALNKSGVFCGD